MRAVKDARKSVFEVVVAHLVPSAFTGRGFVHPLERVPGHQFQETLFRDSLTSF
jgi:hypothetical protein